MHCFCGSTACACVDVCNCCPLACTCPPCFEIRRRQGHCRVCGGTIGTYTCGRIPAWKNRGPFPFPDLDFLRTRPHLSNSSETDERTRMERSIPEANQSSNALQRSVPDISRSPAREHSSDDDSLMFQMDDIDTPPRPSKTSSDVSSETKNDVFHGSSHFSLKTNFVDTKQLEILQNPIRNPTESEESEMLITKDIPSCSHHSVNIPKFEQPQGIAKSPELKCSGSLLKSTESEESEMLITKDIPSCSHHSANIPKFEQPQGIAKSPELKFSGSLSKSTESEESEMLITKDIRSCSSPRERDPKPEETQTTDSVSSFVDEYASDSLPSALTSDSPPSEFSVSSQSPTCPLSTSAPSIYDPPQAVLKLEPSTNSI